MKFLPLLALTFLLSHSAYSQGCVAIRGNSSPNTPGSALNLTKGEWNTQMGFRYFESFRHFRGSEEEANRVEEGTQVINNSYFLDFAISYGITDRFFANAILPFVKHDRSSMYEHGGNPPNGLGDRHSTSSAGLADVRIGLGYWLFEPGKHPFNYSVGLGVKLPTGKYDYTDVFYNQGPDKDENLELVVDQSIQPGDGGTGLALDIQGIHSFSPQFGLTADLYYLFNVKETNGVLTRNGNSEFSCPDQFAARLGSYYSLISGINAYLGGRVEGVPSDDIIGGSAGYRRPGFAVSVEPGIGYTKNKFSLFVSVPVAVYRNRVQSYSDKQSTLETGVFKQGDAAFADYLINVGASYRFGGKQDMAHEMPVFEDVEKVTN
ncbi:MAG: transporter [Saprospiraceae bacterium]|nr:transporter [Saprospiraceae bacterium]